MKILVTGSAGFIGYYLSKYLLESGAMVLGIDNFNTYYSPELKKARNDVLESYNGYTSLKVDLSDRQLVDSAFSSFEPAIVCHLAAQAGVRYSLQNPYTYQKSNLEAFVNLLEAAKRSRIKRFVYASSSSVYGGNTKMPYSEDDPVNTPISLYAATKRANELMAYTYTHLWNMQTIGLRFFTVHGAMGRPDMAYWSFVENILRSEPIRVFNYGKNKRDFTYIDDIIAGLNNALFIDGLAPYEIINLGNNTPVELMEFIGTLEDLLGKKAVMEMVEPQPGDVAATYADIEKARRKLNFAPITDLRTGLEVFVNWYQSNPELTEKVRAFRRSYAP